MCASLAHAVMPLPVRTGTTVSVAHKVTGQVH